MGTQPMAPLRLLYSFSDAGRAAKTLHRASTEEELQQLVMQYDAIQHTMCEHSIRRSLGPCQQGINTGGASQGCCPFHEVLQDSKDKVEAWLEEGPKIHVECHIKCGDDEETVSMELRQRLSVEAAKRVLVRQAALQWEKNCVTEAARELRVQLASRLMAPEDVVVRMGECILGNNTQTLASEGVEAGATLHISIARKTVEQKVHPVYAATEVASVECRESERKRKEQEERRLREKQRQEERRVQAAKAQEKRQRWEREREQYREQYRPHWHILKSKFRDSPQYEVYREKERRKEKQKEERRRQEEEWRRQSNMWRWQQENDAARARLVVMQSRSLFR